MLSPAAVVKLNALLLSAKNNCMGVYTSDQAIKDADLALKIMPTCASALVFKGTALMKKQEDEEALKCFDAALKIEPHDQILLNKADCLLRLRQPAEALTATDQALKMHQSAQAHMVRARIMTRLERFPEAKHEYDLAISEQEKDKRSDRSQMIFPHSDRAAIEVRLRHWDAALADLNFCLSDPKLKINQSAYDQLLLRAKVYKELKQYDKAIVDLKRVLKVNSDYRQAHIALAEVYKLTGKSDLAQAQLKEVESLDQDMAPVK